MRRGGGADAGGVRHSPEADGRADAGRGPVGIFSHLPLERSRAKMPPLRHSRLPGGSCGSMNDCARSGSTESPTLQQLQQTPPPVILPEASWSATRSFRFWRQRRPGSRPGSRFRYLQVGSALWSLGSCTSSPLRGRPSSTPGAGLPAASVHAFGSRLKLIGSGTRSRCLRKSCGSRMLAGIDRVRREAISRDEET